MIDRRAFLASLGATGLAAALPIAWSDTQQTGASAGPADVLLMRHGEEPPHGRDIDDRGRRRANALHLLFPTRFPKPTVLFATKSSKASARPYETLQPLAAVLGLQIDDHYTDEHYAELARQVLTDKMFAGAHVLICWHHGTIRDLAIALKAPNPPVWPETQYDHAWFIRYVGGKATFSDELEHLLPDDKTGPL
jgi:hypothetical protein